MGTERAPTGGAARGAARRARSMYEVRIAGIAPAEALAELGDVTAELAPVSTLLSAAIIDQSDLLGLLARLRSLGLEVIEVRRVP